MCSIAKLSSKMRALKFVIKVAWYLYFWAEICQRPHVSLIANFVQKKFPKILYLGIFGLKFEHYI